MPRPAGSAIIVFTSWDTVLGQSLKGPLGKIFIWNKIFYLFLSAAALLTFFYSALHSRVIVPSLVVLLSCKGLRLLLGEQKIIQFLQPIPPGPCPDCPQEAAAVQGYGHRRVRHKRAGQELWSSCIRQQGFAC